VKRACEDRTLHGHPHAPALLPRSKRGDAVGVLGKTLDPERNQAASSGLARVETEGKNEEEKEVTVCGWARVSWGGNAWRISLCLL
jgi:hypothetical protein